MKVLLDTCVRGGAAKDLRSVGLDVVWAGEWEEDPGDDEILARARHEGRVPVTLDKDFGELAIVRRLPHSGILRLVNLPVADEEESVPSILIYGTATNPARFERLWR